jgi:hypothetical protein
MLYRIEELHEPLKYKNKKKNKQTAILRNQLNSTLKPLLE